MARVLLIVGNGFDLKCELKSSFSAFLSSDFYKDVMERIEKAAGGIPELIKYCSATDIEIANGNTKGIDRELTFWDLFFGLPHYYQIETVAEWYDFEWKINEFITSYDEKNKVFTGKYRGIRSYIPQGNYSLSDEERINTALCVYLSRNKGDLWQLLYSDLKRFEKRFGKYIQSLQENDENYLIKAQDIVDKILDRKNQDKLAYLNTFNYSDLSKIVKDIWHVNGDVDNPIFGVDLPGIMPSDPRYIFTKTYRRLELVGKKTYSPSDKDFSKIVVLGHSLNKQDYSYFYSLFNRLNFRLDSTDRRKGYYIEFVYSKYGDKSSEEVRKETIGRVLELFCSYNEEVLNEKNFRLIDILFSSGLIRFKEIE